MSQSYWTAKGPHCIDHAVPSTQNTLPSARRTLCLNINMASLGALPSPLPHVSWVPWSPPMAPARLFGAPITVATFCLMPTHHPTSLAAPRRQGACRVHYHAWHVLGIQEMFGESLEPSSGGQSCIQTSVCDVFPSSKYERAGVPKAAARTQKELAVLIAGVSGGEGKSSHKQGRLPPTKTCPVPPATCPVHLFRWLWLPKAPSQSWCISRTQG